jgi:BASS family bile acid:Na+ symporter
MSKTTIDAPLAGALALLVAEAALVLGGHGGLPVSGLVLFLMFYAVSVSFKHRKRLSGLSFTFQIFAMVSLALYFPAAFTDWGFDTKVLIVPSVQLIMFGMGTKLSLGDFAREFRKPVKIVIGTALIYIIMPLVGLLIINVYGFEPEVAAGIILIGVCPAGAASNVMTYLANGNIALALSITILATVISPFSTPFLMKLYAGQLIAVDTVGMMISILNMILVPVAAGLICNKILYGKVAWLQRGMNLILVAVAAFAAGVAVALMPLPGGLSSIRSGLVLVLWTVGAVAATAHVMRAIQGPENWMEMVLPKLSLASIMLYIVIVAAQNQKILLVVGPALFVAVIAHNSIGFVLGYTCARALRLSDRDVRTFTIEVGLKNAGAGVGLAYDVLKSQAAALAPLIFGTWMNVSGSALANYWRQRPPREERAISDLSEEVQDVRKRS